MSAAVQIPPPPVPAGKTACACCGGVTGPTSWELPVCLACYEAEQGQRTSPIIYAVQGVSGGAERRTGKFSRKHSLCPLKNPPTTDSVPTLARRTRKQVSKGLPAPTPHARRLSGT